MKCNRYSISIALRLGRTALLGLDEGEQDRFADAAAGEDLQHAVDPKADAELHGLIGQMMNGAEAAQGKQGDAKRADGVVAVAKALNTYGDYFDHKGWKKIDVGH